MNFTRFCVLSLLILSLMSASWAQNGASPASSPRPMPTQEAVSPEAAPAPVPTAVPESASPDVTPPQRSAAPRRPALSSRRGQLLTRIVSEAHRMKGTPYVFGGTSARGVDCSGFVQRVFALAGIKLRRMADEQYYQGSPIKVPSLGDLVFFSTYTSGVSHVGIYLGNRLFIHAASSRGVTISSLEESYYRSRYVGARRVF